MTDDRAPREACDSELRIRLPSRLHDALCRLAIRENGGNVSELIRDRLQQVVSREAGSST